MPDEPSPAGAVTPTSDVSTSEEIASAILEVASIQADLILELQRTFRDIPASGALKTGFQGMTRVLIAHRFEGAALLKRSAALIEWLLQRLPPNRGKSK